MRSVLTALILGSAFLSAAPAFSDAVKDGHRVFMTKSCMACHGRNGAKPIATYPALAGQNAKYLLTQLKAIKSGDRTGTVDPETGHTYVQGMADIMHLLSDDDMKNVVAYLAEQDPAKPEILDPAPTEDELAAGAKLYKKLGCRSCHGKEGSKPSNKAYPFVAGLDRDYLVRAMTEIRDKVRTSGKSKMMFGTIKRADDDQIAAIATWLSQIDRNAE
ncbi:c-type cytochrome [Profundibacter sp.]